MHSVFSGHNVREDSVESAESNVEVMTFVLVCWAVEKKVRDSFPGCGCSPSGIAGLAFVHVCAVKPEKVSVEGDMSTLQLY